MDAIILRLVDHAEKNRVVTFFTAEHGPLAAYARNARGSKRRFGGHLDLFHRGEAEFGRRKTGLATLTSFEVREPREGLRTDVVRFAIASFFAELVLQTTAEGDANPAQFEVLIDCLDRLATGHESERRDLILAFQLRWFDAMGNLPPLTEAGLAQARLPYLEPQPMAIARGLRAGVDIPELDAARFTAVGALTRALRGRCLSRPLESTRFLHQVLSG